jgi:adenosylhomocysteine nucleosidase
MPRALIVLPQSEELAPFLRRVHDLGHPSRPVEVGQIGAFEIASLNAVIALGGHGKAQFALQSQYLIDRLGKVETLVCLGAAGGLSPTLRLGDVVVATTTVEHDYKLRFVAAASPRHAVAAIELDAFRALAATGEFAFRVHLGPIASGDEDIVDAVRAAELPLATGALCVAWEGSGAARVASFNGLGFVEVRCITDAADASAASSFHENCKRLLPHAAELLVKWLSSTVA